MHVRIYIEGKTNSFWKNCNNIPGESCLQKKALSDTIVLSKICLGFFCIKVISSVETVVSEIKDNKPVKTDTCVFPYFFFTSIGSAFIPPFLLFKGRNQATYNIRNQDFSLQLPVPQKTKQTIILTTNRVSKKSLNAECLNDCTNINSMSIFSSYLLTLLLLFAASAAPASTHFGC